MLIVLSRHAIINWIMHVYIAVNMACWSVLHKLCLGCCGPNAQWKKISKDGLVTLTKRRRFNKRAVEEGGGRMELHTHTQWL